MIKTIYHANVPTCKQRYLIKQQIVVYNRPDNNNVILEIIIVDLVNSLSLSSTKSRGPIREMIGISTVYRNGKLCY